MSEDSRKQFRKETQNDRYVIGCHPVIAGVVTLLFVAVKAWRR